MLVANEWEGFVKTRKTLRVTSPRGLQRSSYFVSVPLKYGLPVLISISVLHYTMSQSIFVVYLTRFLSNGTEDTANRTATSGYSCIAIMICELHPDFDTCAEGSLTSLSPHDWLCTSSSLDSPRRLWKIPQRDAFSLDMQCCH